MGEKVKITKTEMINGMLQISHGDLGQFVEFGLKAVETDPELFGHLISWNRERGQVRDSKVSWPVLALRGAFDPVLFENAVANLCMLSPKYLLKAVYFNGRKGMPPVTEGGGSLMKAAVHRYLSELERSRSVFDRVVVQHRRSLKKLYKFYHADISPYANLILFDKTYVNGSIFEAVKNLHLLDEDMQAGVILQHRIPWLVASSRVGVVRGKKVVALALMDVMTRSELLNNTRVLTRWGVFDDRELHGAYKARIEKTRGDKRVATMRASKAAAVVKDKKVKAQIERVQQEQLDTAKKIPGNVLVAADKSISMSKSIELSRKVADVVSTRFDGDVHYVFFDTAPTYIGNVKDWSLKKIVEKTGRIRAGSSTSIGCSLDRLYHLNIVVDCIILCTDGGENTTPLFAGVYRKYCNKFSVEPTVYILWVPGDPDRLSDNLRRENIVYERYDVSEVDDYSLGNLVNMMRAGRYALLDEIMAAPLLTLDKAFKMRKRMKGGE